MSGKSQNQQVSEIQAAHQAFLDGIAAFRANPCRETRAQIDEAAIRYKDLMTGYYDPENPFPKKKGRPRTQQPEVTP